MGESSAMFYPVPEGCQSESNPIGVNDADSEGTIGELVTLRFKCEHCEQPYNILTRAFFRCVGCGKMHESNEARSDCMIFGCMGRVRYEREITIDGQPKNRG